MDVVFGLFSGNGFGKLDDISFRGVVVVLFLRVVDNGVRY